MVEVIECQRCQIIYSIQNSILYYNINIDILGGCDISNDCIHNLQLYLSISNQQFLCSNIYINKYYSFGRYQNNMKVPQVDHLTTIFTDDV